jgi:hypothetical protein
MQSPITVTRLITRKNALDQSRIEQEQRSLTPSEGEVIVKIDRCALTTNNITYAAYGDSMNYWGFFPNGNAEMGHIPAWGFADVIASTVEGTAIFRLPVTCGCAPSGSPSEVSMMAPNTGRH